ncbi:MAG: amino acid ABC transporter permease [Nitrososphaerota archaeon]|nr:amino acid ABC transporter permease [Candidatus Geocrenenecus dongiae]
MSFWEEFIAYLMRGWIMTVELLALSIPLSILLGLALATARVYGNKVVSLIAAGFVALLRGLPLVVTLLIVFFALPRIGLYFDPFWSAVIAFIMCSGAYQSEYVRAAIQSIDVGQSLAAQALGMTKLQEVVHIILPQAFRRALPGISNEIIYLILYSSLAYIIGVQEIFATAKHFNSLQFRPIEIFSTTALIYAFMATVATFFFKKLEERLKIPGLEIV